jgi:hypothetical protein
MAKSGIKDGFSQLFNKAGVLDDKTMLSVEI